MRWGLWLALALAGCDPPPELNAQIVCDAYCNCAAPLPAAQARCASQCEQQLGTQPVPDSCLACLDEPVCTAVETCLVACMPITGTP